MAATGRLRQAKRTSINRVLGKVRWPDIALEPKNFCGCFQPGETKDVSGNLINRVVMSHYLRRHFIQQTGQFGVGRCPHVAVEMAGNAVDDGFKLAGVGQAHDSTHVIIFPVLLS